MTRYDDWNREEREATRAMVFVGLITHGACVVAGACLAWIVIG